MSGYWRDPDGDRGRVHAPTARCARATSAGSTSRAGCGSPGRSKEMYVRGGYNVYPMEVEAVLAEHPAVAAVAVVPRPDDVMGEVGVAVVVPRAERRAAPRSTSCRAFASDRLAAYKLPEAMRVVDAPAAHRDGEGRPAGAPGAGVVRRPHEVSGAMLLSEDGLRS